MILFEPFHSSVDTHSADLSYVDGYPINQIIDQYHRAKSSVGNKWLLRNHLNEPSEELSEAFVSDVWKYGHISGLKSIRLHLHISLIYQHLSTKIIYIIRHPLAVIASIHRRPNFWGDLGWDTHWLHFWGHHGHLYPINEQDLDLVQKEALIWSTMVSKALLCLDQIKIQPFYYEDFYQDPFVAAKKLLDQLKVYARPIHPAHIFTPALSEMKTIHGKKGPLKFSSFWSNTLSSLQVDQINQVLHMVGDRFPIFRELCTHRSYL